jgi:hypothetical protein
LDKEASLEIPLRELVFYNEDTPFIPVAEEYAPVSEDSNTDASNPKSYEDLQEALRLEAYSWPRLVFPPLKKSGHIILDSCTAEG